MMAAVQQDSTDEMFTLQATGTDDAGALRQTVAERVAMHRNRRAQQAQQEADAAALRREEVRRNARTGVSRVRDAVSARYEKSQSYREYLADEAERALAKAQAEAEIAARNARAVAEAQIQLLEELDTWAEPAPSPREQALEALHLEARGELAHALADIALGARELIRETGPVRVPSRSQTVAETLTGVPAVPGAGPLTEVSSGGLTIRLYDGLDTRLPAPHAMLQANRAHAGQEAGSAPEELHDLQQEIELRHAREAAMPHIVETTPIPANLIEFPRQLIAPRKARPRLAEGPLREDAPAEPQMRIFEVEAEQIAVEPAPSEPAGAPGWQELLLDSATADPRTATAEGQAPWTLPPQIAPLGRRLFATAVDAACIAAAAAAFGEGALRCSGHTVLQTPKPLLCGALGAILLMFFVAYQLLFFTVSDATPGMRAARLALCTFGDDNPTRKAMRRRVLATLLAACPLGIGLLWSFLDDEKLGWHDRMSRMYQRGY